MEHAHQDVWRAGGVGQGAEDVENRLHAQLFADGGDVFHGGVVIRREHETEADVGDALGNRGGRQVDVDAQGLQHVGTAGLAADAATAVLADFGTGCRRYKHGTSRNVESVRAVATGADDVDQVGFVRHLDLGGELAHDLRGGGDFTNRLFFDTQAGDERGHHDGRHLAAHDEAHQVQHFVVEDFAVLYRA